MRADGVSRSAYYQHARGRQPQRERVDQVLTEKITAVHEQSKVRQPPLAV
ncbi:hypothetical protein ACVCAH_24390 [Micromonospora sp. LZ34]